MYVRHAPRNCIVGHGFFDLEFVRMDSSAMDSSAIGVGVAVLVNLCKDPGARCLIFGVSDSTETFLTVGYCSQISMHLSTSYSLCSAVHESSRYSTPK